MSDDAPEQQMSPTDVFFHRLERIAYMLLGLLLAIAAALALVNATVLLFHGILSLGDESIIFEVIDRLLFVFMMIEILHTVRASIHSGGLSCEPFLVVGLIASIRRVLVITIQTSQQSQKQWTPDSQAMMHAAMVELGVMAALILAMVVSIFLLHRARPDAKEPAGSSI